MDTPQARAKRLVRFYVAERLNKMEGLRPLFYDVKIVWFSSILGNWKALVTTTIDDGMYYEVTYNSDKKETYLDAYKKWENICVSDDEIPVITSI